MKNIGLYIHIPFCDGKCPYCDFYSIKNTEEDMDKYVRRLNGKISECHSFTADTVYFGGGTPSLLGTERIISLLKNIKKNFGDIERETTLEVNPESAKDLDFEKLNFYGINRVSMGLQSADESELLSLGRKHSPKDAADNVGIIKKSGIDNISLDLMIGISGQTEKSLSNSIDFCADLGVKHISAYILKIEESTPYYKIKNRLDLPDDDTVCDFYEMMTAKLDSLGFKQYEISNFAKPGFESRHNLKYWNCEEYLGLGAAAHSFIDKKRFYCSRSIEDFYSGIIVPDGHGGDEEEYISMTLRLSSGLEYEKFKAYFGYELPGKYVKRADKLTKTGLLISDSKGIRLTVKGFLCSNSIIVELMD